MARGWESKSVEEQQDEPLEDRGVWKPPEQRENEAKLQGLERSRTRIERELQEATTEAHKAALKNALEYLDAEIRALK